MTKPTGKYCPFCKSEINEIIAEVFLPLDPRLTDPCSLGQTETLSAGFSCCFCKVNFSEIPPQNISFTMHVYPNSPKN